jgi:hypothetical protein
VAELDELVRAHLVVAAGVDRYEQHDLLRAYASELETDPRRRCTACWTTVWAVPCARCGCCIRRPWLTISRLCPGIVVDNMPGAAARDRFTANDAVLTRLIRLPTGTASTAMPGGSGGGRPARATVLDEMRARTASLPGRSPTRPQPRITNGPRYTPPSPRSPA